MPQDKNAPNRYDLRGASAGVQITYTLSNVIGKSRLVYRGKPREKTFTGSDIRIAESELGTLVTVTLDQVPDLRTVTLTILLPTINLGGTSAVPFKTTAVRTTIRTSIAGPRLLKGPIQSYENIALEGTARRTL